MKQYKFEIIDYFDVWGNKKDGYEVNDVVNTHIIVELEENYTDKDIIKALKDVGYLKNRLWTKKFDISGEFNLSLYINSTLSKFAGYYPLCELRNISIN